MVCIYHIIFHHHPLPMFSIKERADYTSKVTRQYLGSLMSIDLPTQLGLYRRFIHVEKSELEKIYSYVQSQVHIRVSKDLIEVYLKDIR